ncbi:class I SAM-dependent methyltransferase [Rhodovulum marinum]|uniref:Methyltransferase family protein n=1 Tax=Rhodovulum marinum TaxID=320662 RepID=A0A4R2PWM5_9RHOB|nr:class I SAM-dependent methyltransferase [Rhodovulum marinum]TCP40552.1 methyltransferase family protein [Rhodovulum marinum]
MTGPDAETLAVYSARASDYSEIHHGDVAQSVLTAFIGALPPGGAALDLGCGPGWGAAAMRDAGLSVTAMDACPEMARVARDRYGLTVQVGSFDDLDFRAAFDGVWASFCLLHAPRAALPRHLSAIHCALRPGGRVMVAMKLGTGEARDSIGRLYTYVTRDELRGLLGAAGFAPEAEVTEPSVGFDGTPCDVIFLTARRD